MQTIDEVKKHRRVVGEEIAAAVAAGEDLGKWFEGVQGITLRKFFDTAYWSGTVGTSHFTKCDVG